MKTYTYMFEVTRLKETHTLFRMHELRLIDKLLRMEQQYIKEMSMIREDLGRIREAIMEVKDQARENNIVI